MAQNEHIGRRYCITNERLSTFRDWPHQAMLPPRQMVEAGWWFPGNNEDEVVCCVCNLRAFKWVPGDTPWGDHAQHSPDCPLVNHKKQSINDEILRMNDYILSDKYTSGTFSDMSIARNKTGDIFAVKRLVFAGSRQSYDTALEALVSMPAHDNVVRVQDVFFHHALPRVYILMDCYSPLNLNDVIINNDDIAVKTKLGFMVDIARGLTFLHHHSITHGDLRPVNIFMVYAVTGLVGKISDYGIAAIQESAMDREQRIGDYFKAPEVQETGRYSKAGDIFSMAQVFFVMLSEYKTKEKGKDILVPALDIEDSAYTVTLLARKGVLADILRRSLAEIKILAELMVAMLQIEPERRLTADNVFTKICEASGSQQRAAEDSGTDGKELLEALLLLHLFNKMGQVENQEDEDEDEDEPDQESHPEPSPEPQKSKKKSGLGQRLKNAFRKKKN